MVKVFPAGAFGPGYLREIKGPFRDIDAHGVGGVTAENMRAFFEAGASRWPSERACSGWTGWPSGSTAGSQTRCDAS